MATNCEVPIRIWLMLYRIVLYHNHQNRLPKKKLLNWTGHSLGWTWLLIAGSLSFNWHRASIAVAVLNDGVVIDSSTYDWPTLDAASARNGTGLPLIVVPQESRISPSTAAFLFNRDIIFVPNSSIRFLQ